MDKALVMEQAQVKATPAKDNTRIVREPVMQTAMAFVISPEIL
jgi:hypothetical protein